MTLLDPTIALVRRAVAARMSGERALSDAYSARDPGALDAALDAIVAARSRDRVRSGVLERSRRLAIAQLAWTNRRDRSPAPRQARTARLRAEMDSLRARRR